MIDTLTPRLKIALSYVPTDTVIMDVGADLGLLSIALARHGHKVYASENKKGPYNALQKNISEWNKDNLFCVFADGIDVLPQDVNCLTILGMGGKTIYSILSRHSERLKQIEYILIEPQSENNLPISFLLNSGYENIQGCYILETRYYPILLFKRTLNKREYSVPEMYFGPYPLKNKDQCLKEYLLKEYERFQMLSEVAQKQNAEYIQFLKGVLKQYE